MVTGKDVIGTRTLPIHFFTYHRTICRRCIETNADGNILDVAVGIQINKFRRDSVFVPIEHIDVLNHDVIEASRKWLARAVSRCG